MELVEKEILEKEKIYLHILFERPTFIPITIYLCIKTQTMAIFFIKNGSKKSQLMYCTLERFVVREEIGNWGIQMRYY